MDALDATEGRLGDEEGQTVPGQVPDGIGDVAGQGPPPAKERFQLVSDDDHWQRHEQHLAFLKTLGSWVLNFLIA